MSLERFPQEKLPSELAAAEVMTACRQTLLAALAAAEAECPPRSGGSLAGVQRHRAELARLLRADWEISSLGQWVISYGNVLFVRPRQRGRSAARASEEWDDLLLRVCDAAGEMAWAVPGVLAVPRRGERGNGEAGKRGNGERRGAAGGEGAGGVFNPSF